MAKEYAVEIRNLIKEFPSPFRRKKHRAVDQVSLTIEPGEVYGLIGPNGSGKSTTMKALLGLLAPTEGECFIYGRNSLKVDSRQNIGFLPENPYFYKHLSGEETLDFYGKLCGMRGKMLRNRVAELLELVSLTDAKDRQLGGYSKGMLQRIGLAQAMIQHPKLLVLDEPTAGVDPIGSRQIRDLILQLKQQGITVFLCSHLLEQVQDVCDKVGIIFQGKMIRDGRLDELISMKGQKELIMSGVSDELLERIEKMIADDPQAKLLQAGSPRTTLERLFLSEVEKATD
ncbi:ABC transporter ATP-binding protein [Persicirhabdus sediminis]|uniref:ABC transporter ATP-binding protein n=1 Tax=Persicirhabdus sediminis TaxID=454144 RepID=A0A8J7MB93_9BACT|nr:ABC transporter ATP-binding protein [Persicirhabdus sediminis]MBK1789863.1 ABC transporter ATP-binding protein [Persicirhabdus sediminis]